jgi:PAS domain S-box-containing protein
MPKNDSSLSKRNSALKEEAEKLHSERPAKNRSLDDPALLVHELEVHQIELEMRNEELQNARLEAEDSRNKYLDLYDFAPVGYLTLSEKGVISELNLTAARFLGIERISLVGKPLHHFIESEFQDVFYLHIQRALESPETKACELLLKKNDGTFFDVRLDSVVVEVNGQRVMHTVLTDITERKRSEGAVRATQMQLSEAMDLALIVYWETDPIDNVFLFNDAFYALYGTTAEQEGGYRMTREEFTKRFVHPDDLFLISQFVEQNTLRPDDEFVADIEHRIVRRDGEVRHILVRASVVKDNSGRIVKRYGANQDITERKRMEKALEESEEQFRKMYEGSPIGMVMAGADFRLTKANPAFCRMLGYTEDELTSLTFRDITHPDHIAEDALHVNELNSGKIPLYQTEKRYIRKDKEIVWGSTRVNIVYGRDGKFLYCLTMIEDITQRKLSEEEKARLEGQLFQSQKMEAIGTLAGGIAHDFNNILTALTGYAGLMQKKMDTSDPLGPYVEQILVASQKATGLIQSLLAFSRQQPFALTPLDMNDTITEMEKLLGRLLTEDIELRTSLTDDDTIVMADKSQMDQIFFNLVTNARDAMPKGGMLAIETATAAIDAAFIKIHGFGKKGKHIKITISDTGVGMDETTKGKIFDPFFTTKEVGKGTGLGLATVYGIVKQHEGYVTVESEPNQGTTFNIYFPTAKMKVNEEQDTATPIRKGNETILIADDDNEIRHLVRDALQAYGYSTVEAIDGEDAIDKYKHNWPIDLIVLDVVMPKKNGREIYEEIHNIDPHIKVLFISGYTRDIVLDKGIESGEFDFMAKPLLLDELLQKVREMLDR